MKTAFLYAGQGSQHTGMGLDLYNAKPEFKEAYIEAEAARPGILSAIFDNPDNILMQTEYTQPAMVAFACGVTSLLKKANITPDACLGLSLGEYSALAAAEVWNTEDAIRIAAFRGHQMALAAKDGQWGMSAVLGLTPEQVSSCCQEGAFACNLNCPGQVVIGGEKNAVEESAKKAKEAGAKRCLPLSVSGPFHTPFMKRAADALQHFLPSFSFAPLKTKVIYNTTGDDAGLLPGEPCKDALIDILTRQVQSPVHMQSSLEHLLQEGYDTFVEIGPGKALSGFIKKTASSLGISSDQYRIITIETLEDLENAIKELS
ncbi:[acyl-carrier-protein] S-malonyltransferase [Lachnospiraceae bacterium C10]|jgi:[acyl-carrier-protein] S-malonyltransferase|nr:[acyl-carrier-protein] S-malonyltransferase [Lachnospiraceae bacterium C10]SDW41445.1 [acyl-carrier-protein] S-malonyltransferase [Lachnospiraceae bacterium KHCPX20]